MPVIERGSRRAAAIGRWGMALTLVIAAVLFGRLIRAVPYLLPNRLPGLVLYELAPGLILALAIGAALAITRDDAPRFGVRLALFALTAAIAGAIVLAWEHDAALQGQWM